MENPQKNVPPDCDEEPKIQLEEKPSLVLKAKPIYTLFYRWGDCQIAHAPGEYDGYWIAGDDLYLAFGTSSQPQGPKITPDTPLDSVVEFIEDFQGGQKNEGSV